MEFSSFALVDVCSNKSVMIKNVKKNKKYGEMLAVISALDECHECIKGFVCMSGVILAHLMH